VTADVSALVVDLPAVLSSSNVTNASIPCVTSENDTVSWLHINFETAEQFAIYRHGHVVHSLKDKFKAVAGHASGNHSLVLINAQKDDSGWYVCVVENGKKISSSRIITLNVSGEYISCVVI
jgi:Immunoglobulin V-set domain